MHPQKIKDQEIGRLEDEAKNILRENKQIQRLDKNS